MRAMRNGVKAAVVGCVCVTLLGGAGYGLYNVASALNGDGGPGGSAAVRTGPPSDSEVKETTGAFFTAWEKGDAVTAASYTNNDTAAEPLLTAFAEDAHITGVRITPGRASGTTA
jgi:hypothetical protein